MINKLKKYLAITLSIVMILSMLPASALEVSAATHNFRDMGVLPADTRAVDAAGGAFVNTGPGAPIIYTTPLMPTGGTIVYSFQFQPMTQGTGAAAQINQQLELAILPAGHPHLGAGGVTLDNLRSTAPIYLRFASHTGPENLFRYINGIQGGATAGTIVGGYQFSINETYDVVLTITNLSYPAPGNWYYSFAIYDSSGTQVGTSSQAIRRTIASVIANPTHSNFAGGIGGVYVSRNGGGISAISAVFTFPAANAFAASGATQYTVTVTANPTNGGTVTGGGTFDENTPITVTADANSGFDFVGWYDGAARVSTDESFTFTLTGSLNLEARFEQSGPPSRTPFRQRWTAPFASRNITSNAVIQDNTGPGQPIMYYPPAIPVGNTLVYSFLFHQRVQGSGLHTTPAMSTVVGIYPNVDNALTPLRDGANTLGVRNTAPILLHFRSNNNGINIFATTSAAGNGTQTGGITEIPRPGGGFAGYLFSHDVEYEVVVTIDITASTFTVQIYNDQNVLVAETAALPIRTGTFNEPIPPAHRDFSAGIGGVAIRRSETNNLQADFTFPAQNAFGSAPIIQYTVAASVYPASSGTVTGYGTFDENTEVTLVATPANGFDFVGWYESATRVSSDESFAFYLTGNRNLEARFETIATTYFDVTVTAEPSTMGAVSGGGNFAQGTQVTVTATPVSGYIFAGWFEGGVRITGAGAAFTFSIQGNRVLEARFEADVPLPPGMRNFMGIGRRFYQDRNILVTTGAINDNTHFPPVGEPIVYEVPPLPDQSGILPFGFKFTPRSQGGGNTSQSNQQVEISIVPSTSSLLPPSAGLIADMRNLAPIVLRFASHDAVGPNNTGGPNSTVRAISGTVGGGNLGTPMVCPLTGDPFVWTFGQTYDVLLLINTASLPLETFTAYIYHNGVRVAQLAPATTAFPNPAVRTNTQLTNPLDRNFAGAGIGGVFVRRNVNNPFAIDFAFPADNAFGGRPPDPSLEITNVTPLEDGFELTWAANLWENQPYEVTLDSFVVEWAGDDNTNGTFEFPANVTMPVSLRSASFTYDVVYSFIVRGLEDITTVVSSTAVTDEIIDNRDVAVTVDGFVVTWSAVYGADYYVVYFGEPSQSLDDAARSVRVYAPATTATVVSLLPNTWHIRVVAYQNPSTILRVWTPEPVQVQGEAVTIDRVVAGEDRFTIEWSSLGTYTGYEIAYTFTPAGSSSETTIVVSDAVSPQVIGSVAFDYDVEVSFVVRGLRSGNEPVVSNAVSSQILDRRPAAPRAFANGFSYSWSAVWTATHYYVRFGTDANNLIHSARINAPDTRATVRDDAIFTTIGETWHFAIAAYNGTNHLRTLSGMSVTTQESAPLEPQTLILRDGLNGYNQTLNVGFMHRNNAANALRGGPGGFTLGVNSAVALIYFGLKDIFPIGVDPTNIFVTDATVTLTVGGNHTNPRTLWLNRVLDNDNVGMWAEGTQMSPDWSNTNDGVSWLHRNNIGNVPWMLGAQPNHADGGNNLGSSVVPEFSGSVVAQGLTTFDPFTFTGPGLAQDINNWLQGNAPNQGWMISGDTGTLSGPLLVNRFNAIETRRPTLTLTFLDLTDVDEALLFFGDITPAQDGFHLEWFPFSDPPMDRFVIEYWNADDSVTGSIDINDPSITSMFVGNHLFYYDDEITFMVTGFVGSEAVFSEEKSSKIVDNRSFMSTPTGFELSWSRVYGAQSYVVTYWDEAETWDDIYRTTNTEANIVDSIFGFGVYYYRLVAFSGPNGTGEPLRDSGPVRFSTIDDVPPITTWTVQSGAHWAHTAADALLLPVNRGPVTIRIDSAYDPMPGSGVNRTEFRFNDDHRYTNQFNQIGRTGTAAELRWNLVRDPWNRVEVGNTITVSDQGVTRVWIRSVDNDGNYELPRPIYIVIDYSPVIVSTPVVTQGGIPIIALPASGEITVSMAVSSTETFAARMQVGLFDAQGRMLAVAESPPASFSSGTPSNALQANITIPSEGVPTGRYLRIFLVDPATSNPINEMIMFPHQLNTISFFIPERPMFGAILTHAAPPTITHHPDSLIVVGSALVSGDMFRLTVGAEPPAMGSNSLTYQWYRNGAAVPGAVNASLDIDVSALGGNGIYDFYVVVTNTRADATGNIIATAQSQTAQITITDAISLAIAPNRTFVMENGRAAEIDTLLPNYTSGLHWFRDHDGIWRDSAGRPADAEQEVNITWLVVPATPRVSGPMAGTATPMTDFYVIFDLFAAHGFVSVEALDTNPAITGFAVEVLDVRPGDITTITPIGEAAAIAYALPGDAIRLFLYGENNVLLGIREGVLTIDQPVGEVTLLHTNVNSLDSITIRTQDEHEDDVIVDPSRVMRVRYNDGTRIGGLPALFYVDLVRINGTTWRADGLDDTVLYYHVLGGAVRGYDTTVIILEREPDIFTVTVNIVGGGEVEGLEENGLYEDGDTATLTAVPDYGYLFVGWFDSVGALITRTLVHSFTVDDNVTIEARFILDDGMRTLFLQNGRSIFEGGPVYNGNSTRNGIHDGMRGDPPAGSGLASSDLFIWNRIPEFTGTFVQHVQQSVLHFDLDGVIPNDATLVSATLHLGNIQNANQGGRADLHLYRLFDPSNTGMWSTTGSVSWQNKNGIVPWSEVGNGSVDTARDMNNPSAVIEDIDLTNQTPNWLTTDVTADVMAWLSGEAGSPNMGWLLRQENAVRGTAGVNNPGAVIIANAHNSSHQIDGASSRPMLELVYTMDVVAPEETLLTLTAPMDITLTQSVVDYASAIALLPTTVDVTTTGATASLPIIWSFSGTFDAAPGAQNTFTLAAQLGTILPGTVTTSGTIVVTNLTATATQTITGNFGVINPHLNVTVELMQGSTVVATQVVRAATGNTVDFTFNNVAVGVYNIVFTRPGHTSFTVKNVAVALGSDIDLLPELPAMLSLWPGDINGDGVIDNDDLIHFMSLMFTTDERADLNGDGMVNAFDRILLMAHMGRESDYIDLLQ